MTTENNFSLLKLFFQVYWYTINTLTVWTTKMINTEKVSWFYRKNCSCLCRFIYTSKTIFLKITYHFLHFYPESIAGRLTLGPLKDDSTILLLQQGSLVCSEEKKEVSLHVPTIIKKNCPIFTIANLNRSPTILSCLQIHFPIAYFFIWKVLYLT